VSARRDERDTGEVEVYLQPDGRWRWLYRDRTSDVELTSNHTFEAKPDAVASAHRAYPHIVPPPEETESGTRKPLLVRLVIALVLLALLVVAIRVGSCR
jgi:hypothetical protein